VFSPRSVEGSWEFRDQPPEFWDQFMTQPPPDTHLRIHPLLQWIEIDIWRYIQRENIPMVDLYFARDGMRYRSLGDRDITSPVESTASPTRLAVMNSKRMAAGYTADGPVLPSGARRGAPPPAL
jgi:sulfate adenylyltransferase subunit 2